MVIRLAVVVAVLAPTPASPASAQTQDTARVPIVTNAVGAPRTRTSQGAVLRAGAAKSRLDSMRALFGLPDMPLINIAATASPPPAASLGSPTAYGAAWGDAFVGAGYQNRVRYSHLGDGAVTAGGGLGNPNRTVGLEVTATSYSTLRQGFGTNGSMSLKLHRVVTPRLAIAFGYENAVPWGHTDGGSSLYAVATRLIPIRRDPSHVFGGIGVSLGIGNARFRSQHDVEHQIPGANVFGSTSVRINERIVAIADWTGQDLNVGTAIRLKKPLPLSISLGFADLTHRAGDGPRFIAGAGWAFRFQ